MSEAHIKDPYSFSNKGARWNNENTSMIYTSSTPSLAMLEYITIKGPIEIINKNWFMIQFNINDITLIDDLVVDYLPADWNSLPHSNSTKIFGSEWLNEKGNPFLKVPSARIDLQYYPIEYNLLINASFLNLKKILSIKTISPLSYLINQ